jgi:hypothetical protein
MLSTTKNSKHQKFERVKEHDCTMQHYRSSSRIVGRTSKNPLGSSSDGSSDRKVESRGARRREISNMTRGVQEQPVGRNNASFVT